MATSPAGLGIKNDCADEEQEQFTPTFPGLPEPNAHMYETNINNKDRRYLSFPCIFVIAENIFIFCTTPVTAVWVTPRILATILLLSICYCFHDPNAFLVKEILEK
jgi:hypothetical protein